MRLSGAMPRRVIISLLSACLIAFVPWTTARFFPAYGPLSWAQLVIACLVLPGLLVNLVLSGNVHGGTLWVVHLANVLFYFCLIYYAMLLRTKRREQNNPDL
jgi:hypothetical protein